MFSSFGQAPTLREMSFQPNFLVFLLRSGSSKFLDLSGYDVMFFFTIICRF